MMSTQALYPWEDVDAAVREVAADGAWYDAEYDAWLDAFLTDAYEAWLDDVDEDGYVPFQLAPEAYCDCVGTLGNEIGYAESVTPYLF